MNRVFEDFLLYKAHADGLSNRSIKAYGDILARFEAWLDGKHPADVGRDELLVFTGPYLHKQGLKPISRRPYVACMRELYVWLAKVRHEMETNPAEEIGYPLTGRRLPRFLSLENAEKLLWAPDLDTFAGIRDSAMFAVLIGCGLRVSGICALNDSNLITHIVKNEPRLAIRAIEKGDKERILPMPREADLLLRIYLEHPDMQGIDRSLPDGDKVLFVSTGNRKCPEHEYFGERRRLTQRGIYGIIQRHGLKAGIPISQLHPHAMRHLYGTELAESDVNERSHQQLMGHSDPRSTQVYVHLATKKLTGDVDRANPLAKIKTPVTDLLGKLRNT